MSDPATAPAPTAAGTPEPGSTGSGPVQEALLSYIRMEQEVPCPGCQYNLAGLPGLVCPECGRVFRIADVGFRARPPWLVFARSGWGWLLLAILDVSLLRWVVSLRPPSSETLRLLFFGGTVMGSGLGLVGGLMLGFLVIWFFQRVSRRPRERARAGASLLVAWGLMVIELVGVVLTRLV